MKKILIFIVVIFVSIIIYPQDSQRLDDMEKRINDLEKKNSDLEMELEETKRNLIDNSGDATSDKNINKIAIQKDQWGKEFSFEFSGGFQGVYSQLNIGIIFPKIKNSLFFGLGINYSASIVPSISFDKFQNDIKTNYYSIISPYFKIGGTSPLFFNFIRVYGYGEFLSGFRISSSDEDSYKNGFFTFSIGGFGYSGIEFYTSRWCAIFIEAGGGAVTFIKIHKIEEKYITNSITENATNGFAFNIGVKVFVAKKK